MNEAALQAPGGCEQWVNLNTAQAFLSHCLIHGQAEGSPSRASLLLSGGALRGHTSRRASLAQACCYLDLSDGDRPGGAGGCGAGSGGAEQSVEELLLGGGWALVLGM